MTYAINEQIMFDVKLQHLRDIAAAKPRQAHGRFDRAISRAVICKAVTAISRPYKRTGRARP